jgi:hypothetical protein
MPHTDTNNLLRRNLIHWLKTNHLLITLIVFKLGDFSKSSTLLRLISYIESDGQYVHNL